MSGEKGIIHRLNQISNKIEGILNIFIGIFVGLLGLSVFTGVLGRNINIPVVWLDEVSTYCCIWATFFGFAVASKHEMLSNVDALIHGLSPKMKLFMSIIWTAFGCIFMGIVLWSGKDYIAYAYQAGTLSAQLKIPLVYVYLGPIIGYFFAIFFGIVNAANKIAALKSTERN
ncbi:MAG: TRAP transporter small permease [Clostridium sp.]|nr:TRAP transporter small permease [Clostridium sp.]